MAPRSLRKTLLGSNTDRTSKKMSIIPKEQRKRGQDLESGSSACLKFSQADVKAVFVRLLESVFEIV